MVSNRIIFHYRQSDVAKVVLLLALALSSLEISAMAATCASGDDIPAATRSALERAGRQYFERAAAGDFASLRSSATPALASDFSGVEAAVTQNLASMKGGQSSISSAYLLEAEGSGTLERAEFYCGIFNSPERTTFVIPNLPAGRYAVVIQEITGGGAPLYFTTVLSEQAGTWKLAGLTIKAQQLAGRGADYFLSRAREFKAQGQSLLAWLYYLQGWDLMGPVNFMYTARRDKVADEMQQAKPAELPTQQNPLQLTGGGKTFRVTQIFPEVVDMQGDKQLYLILKYQAITDISNTSQTFEANRDAMRAILARYPELRTAFDGAVARAVDANGRDYGTLLAMKDVK